MRITPLGEIVLTHGRDLLARAEAAADAIDRFKAGEGRVDIGTFQSVSNVILPSIVRRLRDEHPAVDIRLFEEETDQPRADELDILFFDGRVDGDTLRTHPLHPPIPPREIYMLWQAGRTLSPLAHRVIAMATNVANEIINHRPTIS